MIGYMNMNCHPATKSKPKKEIPLNEYIEHKFVLLHQLKITPADTQIVKLRNARSYIHADNIMRDIICPPMADMRIH